VDFGDEMSDFADTLKQLMQKRRLSAKAVSEATGVPTSTLSEWISGKREPQLSDAIVKLARVLGVSVEYLITGVEPEEQIVKDLIDTVGDDFMQIHRGIYRISVEKYSGPKNRGKP
jgi:transcriptional regulator with XRE-family HTH domain